MPLRILGLFFAVMLPLNGCFLMLPLIESDRAKKSRADEENAVPRSIMARGLPKSDPVRKHLLQLDSADAAARTRAATSLGDLGPSARPALPRLILALRDDSKNVRRAAVKALEKVGGPEIEAPLIDKLRDRDKYVRESAANVLRRRGTPRARKALKDFKV